MCIIACYYPFNIPCKLDDGEKIYINVLVLVILPIASDLFSGLYTCVNFDIHAGVDKLGSTVTFTLL